MSRVSSRMERLAQEGAMVKRLVSPRKQQVTVVKNREIRITELF